MCIRSIRFWNDPSSLISRAESNFTLATRISARADSSSVRSCVAEGLLRSPGSRHYSPACTTRQEKYRGSGSIEALVPRSMLRRQDRGVEDEHLPRGIVALL